MLHFIHSLLSRQNDRGALDGGFFHSQLELAERRDVGITPGDGMESNLSSS